MFIVTAWDESLQTLVTANATTPKELWDAVKELVELDDRVVIIPED